MMRSIQGLLYFLSFSLFFSCSKKEFDEYYGRPGWLASPIYQKLDSLGNFKNFLSVVEKAGYKNTLGSAGSWTVFAPTDEAFQKFMEENGIPKVDAITDSLAAKIVRTSMVYDGEKLQRLNNFFSRTGWIEDVAFRRRTVYYDFVENGKLPNGKLVKVISTNRDPRMFYVSGENNNKHLSYFFAKFMDQRNLGEVDYKTFYPQSTYTGLNVAGASIDPANSDIVAENGVIHVIDKVLVPEKNFDQYLNSNSQYSLFKSIIDGFATYTYNESVSRQYQVLTGGKDSVYIKSYTSIGIALNNENFAKEDANDAQINNNSVTIPTNAAVEDYARKVLLKYYPKGTSVLDLFDNNSAILREYVNAHLYNTQLWPSKFNSQNNLLGEAPKINQSNIIEARLLSNGAFYGVNQSQKPTAFHTVYGNVLLDPKYSLMGRALEMEGYNLTLKIPTIRYMLVLVPDHVLHGMGFSYDSYFPGDPIRYNGGSGRTMLRRIMQQHIVPLENHPIPDLDGTGMLETLNGDYIKYSNGRLVSRGTLDSAEVSKPTSVRVDSTNIGIANVSGPTNGIAVYVNGPLSYSEKTIGTHLISLGAENSSSPYFKFFNYLKNSPDMYKVSTGEVTGVSAGINYTFLIPNNTAIDAAVANGLLPASVTPTELLDKDKVKNFLKYHIVRNSFAIDGKKTGTFESLYRDLDDVTHTVIVSSNTNSSVTLKDDRGRVVNTVFNDSNQLADRILIHSLSSYLDYRKN